jgi:hypothetical protein
MKQTTAPYSYTTCLRSYTFTEAENAFMRKLDVEWLEHCQSMRAFTAEGVQSRRDALAEKVATGDHAAGLEFSKLPALEAEVAQARKAAEILDGRFHAGFAEHWPTLKAIGERMLPAFDKLIERHLADIMAITAEINEPMNFTETSVLRWLRSRREFVLSVCEKGSANWATAPAIFEGVIEAPEAE